MADLTASRRALDAAIAETRAALARFLASMDSDSIDISLDSSSPPPPPPIPSSPTEQPPNPNSVPILPNPSPTIPIATHFPHESEIISQSFTPFNITNLPMQSSPLIPNSEPYGIPKSPPSLFQPQPQSPPPSIPPLPTTPPPPALPPPPTDSPPPLPSPPIEQPQPQASWPTPPIIIKRWYPKEIKEKRERGLYYNGDPKLSPSGCNNNRFLLLDGMKEWCHSESPKRVLLAAGDVITTIVPVDDHQILIREYLSDGEKVALCGEPPPAILVISDHSMRARISPDFVKRRCTSGLLFCDHEPNSMFLLRPNPVNSKESKFCFLIYLSVPKSAWNCCLGLLCGLCDEKEVRRSLRLNELLSVVLCADSAFGEFSGLESHSKWKRLGDARKVFDEIPVQNVLSRAAEMNGYYVDAEGFREVVDQQVRLCGEPPPFEETVFLLSRVGFHDFIPTNTLSRLSTLRILSFRTNGITGSFPLDFDVKTLEDEAYLPSALIHVVTNAFQLPEEFRQPSHEKQMVIGLDCEEDDRCRQGTHCIMQLDFPNAIYLVDANEGGETLVKARKPALDSNYISKVIHACKRDSEQLPFQFGIKLHNVVDAQIAYSSIKEQQSQKRIEWILQILFLASLPVVSLIIWPVMAITGIEFCLGCFILFYFKSHLEDKVIVKEWGIDTPINITTLAQLCFSQ